MRAGRGLVLVAVLSLVAAPAAAQSRRPVVGLVGGATLSDFQNPDTESRWGGTAGLFVGAPSYRTLSLLEVNWIQKGGGDTRLDYIEIPLTFGAVARGRGGESRVRFYGGVSVAFKIACDSGTTGLCDAVNGTEWSAPLGLMLGRYKANGSFMGVDARYSFGLSDVTDIGTYNQTWQFRLILGRAR